MEASSSDERRPWWRNASIMVPTIGGLLTAVIGATVSVIPQPDPSPPIPSTSPEPTAEPTPSLVPPSPTSGSPPPPPPPPPPSTPALVLVQFEAGVGEQVYALEAQLSIDGVPQTGLFVDQATGEHLIGVHLAPGEHRYDLGVNWIDTNGFEHLDEGSGTIQAAEGRNYGVRVDGFGSALLVVL